MSLLAKNIRVRFVSSGNKKGGYSGSRQNPLASPGGVTRAVLALALWASVNRDVQFRSPAELATLVAGLEIIPEIISAKKLLLYLIDRIKLFLSK